METANTETEAASQGTENMTDQVAAFQRIWMETLSKLVQLAVKLPPDSAPPEVLRQMRSGVFQGLAQSWDEFLRSPQFLTGMKQWMDSAIMMRKMSDQFMTRTHHEMQATAREDIDSIMLAVRHMEKRLLDRLEQLEEKVQAMAPEKQSSRGNGGGRPQPKGSQKGAARRKGNKTLK
jgi:hypothetical protein